MTSCTVLVFQMLPKLGPVFMCVELGWFTVIGNLGGLPYNVHIMEECGTDQQINVAYITNFVPCHY